MSYHQFHHNPHQFTQDLPQESLLFGIDLDPSKQDSFSTWDDSFPAYPPPSPAALTASPASTSSQLSPPQPFSPNAFPEPISPSHLLDYSSWLVDDLPPVPPVSAPIAIRPGASSPPGMDSFAFNDPSPFDKLGAYSPSLDFASLVPMPSSSSSFDPTSFSPMWAPPPHEQQQQDTTTTTTAPYLLHTAAAVQPPFYTASSFDDNASTVRPRHPAHHRHSTSLSGVFQSASAPSDFHRPALTRPYSSSSASAARRAESVSLSDDRDATVRRKRKPSEIDADELNGASSEDRDRLHAPPASPRRSHLRPPKLAPSTWQLWFADWIQRQQATSDRKLNVAQAAKEAGIEYGKLSPEEKEPYTRRSQQLKDQREKEHALWMQSLSPDDIKRENNFRAAQRKAGRSRRGNIKDPNAPKKPLSAYFNFIQYIRADAERVREVFGDETETTRQSVLAAQKWRSMTDDEKRPFLAQAEHDRLEYDAAKKVYDEQTTGHSSGVSFSVYQGGGFVHSVLRPVPVPTQAREASASSESDDSESDSAGRRSGSSRARA